MHIIGTAGHVDHGKSSLVTALTGTNPDRWLEEQVRGMTLDLGFAHLRFDDGIEAGIVDVPGHARFLHNMLAGAAGMELLLLVVAADDGVMPQTIEHLQILRYLNVRRTIVAVTKSDLLDAPSLQVALEGIRAELEGTIARDAAFISISTVTGAGLVELRARIHAELQALSERAPDAPAYLPIDRVFALAGRGTIVTGTLMQGRITVGDTLSLEPLGRNVRVRSLQVFGNARERVAGGTRVALNLPGIERSELARGAVLADPQFSAHASFAVTFRPLLDAVVLLRRRTQVRAHIGSAEVLGTLVFERVPERDDEVSAQLHLREPVLAFPGVRFVVRRISPKTVLGGGEIVGLERGANAMPMAAALPSDAVGATLRALLAGRALEPQEPATLAFAANLREEVAQQALDALVEAGDAIELARPRAYVEAAAFTAFASSVTSELESAHAREPWAMGVTLLLLARALGIPEPLLVRLLAALADDGRIAQRHGYYAALTHEPKLSSEQRVFFEAHLPYDPSTPFLPASYDTVASLAKSSPISGLSKAFDTLLVRGVVVRVGDALYRGSQIERAQQLVEAFIDAHGRMSMAEFRDTIGTSRKYAVPLLEWFDAHGITIRIGDHRTLRVRKNV
jgi:selenocysteine-specific elongation factor